jgi:uncharacterized repeat protein (TIGR01451 family)
MKRLSLYLLGATLLVVTFASSSGGPGVLAAPENTDGTFPQIQNQAEPPEETPPVESLEIRTSFPIVRGKADASFAWEFQPFYTGSEPKIFEFSITAPEGWQTTLKRQFKESEPSVVAARLLPDRDYPDKYTVTATALPGYIPEPGEYVFVLEGTSGTITGSIELTAVVTEKPLTYKLNMNTNTGRLNTLVKTGEENTYAIRITNSGTGTIENITFNSTKSEGWGITFEPDKVAALEPDQSQDVDVLITPPSQTISGDYSVTLTARGDQGGSDSISLRTTVETSTFWGAAGAGIIAAVVVGLVFLFRRLGRR